MQEFLIILVVVFLFWFGFKGNEGGIIKPEDYKAWTLSNEVISCDMVDKASGAIVLGNGGGSKGYSFMVSKRLKTSFGVVVYTTSVSKEEFMSSKIILNSKPKVILTGDEIYVSSSVSWNSDGVYVAEKIYKDKIGK